MSPASLSRSELRSGFQKATAFTRPGGIFGSGLCEGPGSAFQSLITRHLRGRFQCPQWVSQTTWGNVRSAVRLFLNGKTDWSCGRMRFVRPTQFMTSIFACAVTSDAGERRGRFATRLGKVRRAPQVCPPRSRHPESQHQRVQARSFERIQGANDGQRRVLIAHTDLSQ